VPACDDNAARLLEWSLCEPTCGSNPLPPGPLTNELLAPLPLSAPKERRPPSRAPLARSPRRTTSLPARSAKFAPWALRAHLALRRRRRAPREDTGPLEARRTCCAPVRVCKDTFASRAAPAARLVCAVSAMKLDPTTRKTYASSLSAPHHDAAAAGRYNPDISSTSSAACLLTSPGTYTPAAGMNDRMKCAAGAEADGQDRSERRPYHMLTPPPRS
jgi:hypothetical protein